MNININKTLQQLNGEPLKESDGKDLTVGTVCITALLNDNDGNGSVKVNRYRLMQRMYKAAESDGELVLSAEELSNLKDSVGRIISTPLHAGQVLLYLDPPAEG